jgi:hypothetical protein
MTATLTIIINAVLDVAMLVALVFVCRAPKELTPHDEFILQRQDEQTVRRVERT